MSRARTIADFGDGIATADIDDGAVTAAKLFSGFANGITEADQFRLVSDTSGGTNATITNLERVDDASFEKIGTGMTESSGVFTFPTTGLYLVIATGRFVVDGSDTSANVQVDASSDSGSNFDTVGFATAGNTSGTNGPTYTCSQHFFVNVTNASNFRIKFSTQSMSTNSFVNGSTTDNRTSFTFIRLGDSQ